jgi:PPOX class probable F420-dependent enzyme
MTVERTLLDLAAGRDLGVLATIKRDGRPQLSNVNFCLDVEAAVVRASVVDGRAKVTNLRRDPRASLFVSSADGWSYAVLEGDGELSAVAADPGDATVDELVDVYRSIRGEEHPDWDEYRQAMVTDRRLVLRLAVRHAYGLTRQ